MPTFTDQIGNVIELQSVPTKIVSLVPSQTELLFYLQLNNKILGCTKFCIYPAHKTKLVKKIGGTKNVNTARVLALQPHLVIANKEENLQTTITELQKFVPVWVSEVNSLNDALQMIQSIGNITNTSKKATLLCNNILNKFNTITKPKQTIRVAYLIWKNPYMVAANNTFINNILETLGLHNVFADQTRYPAIDIIELQQKKPDCIFLSSEPYPFKQQHINELQAHFPHSKILLVNGEPFSWYGNRLLYTANYFKKIISFLQ